MLKVAIIDDGINIDFVRRMNPDPVKMVTYRVDSGEVVMCDESRNITHGSMCAAFIRAQIHYNLYSIQIINQKRKGNVENLVTALKWCCHNKMDVINISLGSVRSLDGDKLSETVNLLRDRDTFIVAAYDNRNIYTVPAQLDGVFGVRRLKSASLAPYEYTLSTENKVIMSGMECIEGIHARSNSFATSVFTGILIKKLMTCGKKRLLHAVQEGASHMQVEIPQPKLEESYYKEIEVPIIKLDHAALAQNFSAALKQLSYNNIIAANKKNNDNMIPLEIYEKIDTRAVVNFLTDEYGASILLYVNQPFETSKLDCDAEVQLDGDCFTLQIDNDRYVEKGIDAMAERVITYYEEMEYTGG